MAPAESPPGWQSIFRSSTSPFYGYVYDMEDANDIVSEFCYATTTSYSMIRTTKKFGSFSIHDEHDQEYQVRFDDDNRIRHGSPISLDGIPFMVVGSRLMECHHGPSHRNKDEKKDAADDHSYKMDSSKKRVTGSKKIGCPAAIYMREVIAFPEYKLVKTSDFAKRTTSQRLRVELASVNYTDIEVTRMIFIDLPSPEKHASHIMGDAADLKAPIDGRVVNHIYSIVDEEVYSVNEMKRSIKIFVKTLFGLKALPKPINRRFYPSRTDIRSMIYRGRRKTQMSLIDQDNL